MDSSAIAEALFMSNSFFEEASGSSQPDPYYNHTRGAAEAHKQEQETSFVGVPHTGSRSHNVTQGPDAGTAQHYLDITFLEPRSRKKWTVEAVQEMKSFMDNHAFYNYKSTVAAHTRLLNELTSKIARFFDPDQYDPVIHEKVLKQKIINKIGRIRIQYPRRTVGEVRTILPGINPADYEELLRATYDITGIEEARRVMIMYAEH